MTKSEYVETLVIDGKIVNVGLDDYGQCYFFEFYDENEKQLVEIGCGTYNNNYKEEIEAYFKKPIDRVWETLQYHREWIRDLQKRVDALEDKCGIREDQ